jgi:SNF2 family DNA or RNA helicase
MLDTFSRSPHIGVFLLSTKAGGLGLNLTAADTVILHDIDWNPHSDAQAVDRAHRMGQRRPVTVHRLIAAGTLDEHVARLACIKLELDRALKGGPGSPTPKASRGAEKATIAELLARALE